MTAILTGLATLLALGTIGWLICSVLTHGIAGFLERRSDRHIERAVQLRALAKTWRLMRAQTPALFRGFVADEWREVGR